MSRPFREIRCQVHYLCPPDEGAVLARTSQKFMGVSIYSNAFRSMYGLQPTPYADDILVSLYRMHLFDATR